MNRQYVPICTLLGVVDGSLLPLPAVRSHEAIQVTLNNYLRQMQHMIRAASDDGETEAVSYGFIVHTLVLLNSTISDSRDDSIVGCFPQGVLRTSSGVIRIPDFLNVVFSLDHSSPRHGVVLNWWEAKRFPRGDPVTSFQDEFTDCFAQVEDQAQAVLDQCPQVKYIRAIVSCGTRFSLVEFRSPSAPASPPLYDWVAKQHDDMRAAMDHDEPNLVAVAPKYVAAKAMLEKQFSNKARAKVKGKLAKRTFDQRKKALLAGLEACDECLKRLDMPYIYYFAEPMFKLANPHAHSPDDVYKSISGMTVQFLQALRMLSTPNGPSRPVVIKPSFFDPPTFVDEREISPSDPSTMVCFALHRPFPKVLTSISDASS